MKTGKSLLSVKNKKKCFSLLLLFKNYCWDLTPLLHFIILQKVDWIFPSQLLGEIFFEFAFIFSNNCFHKKCLWNRIFELLMCFKTFVRWLTALWTGFKNLIFNFWAFVLFCTFFKFLAALINWNIISKILELPTHIFRPYVQFGSTISKWKSKK